MQFIILYIGILVFVFYQFHQAPLIHNTSLREKAMQSAQVKLQNLCAESIRAPPGFDTLLRSPQFPQVFMGFMLPRKVLNRMPLPVGLRKLV